MQMFAWKMDVSDANTFVGKNHAPGGAFQDFEELRPRSLGESSNLTIICFRWFEATKRFDMYVRDLSS